MGITESRLRDCGLHRAFGVVLLRHRIAEQRHCGWNIARVARRGIPRAPERSISLSRVCRYEINSAIVMHKHSIPAEAAIKPGFVFIQDAWPDCFRHTRSSRRRSRSRSGLRENMMAYVGLKSHKYFSNLIVTRRPLSWPSNSSPLPLLAPNREPMSDVGVGTDVPPRSGHELLQRFSMFLIHDGFLRGSTGGI
jgi:hypothetical protein